MDTEVIERLTALSAEEARILGGQTAIRKDDYTPGKEFIVNSKKLLGGRQVDMRLHTRFADFPEHGHDYMEFMYVYAGSVTHVIGGEKVRLSGGDILFLNKHIRHGVLRAEREDIGINFILSDAFLKYVFGNVQHNPVMSEFLSRNFDPDGEGEYLFFRTGNTFPVRNLLDNLIYALAQPQGEDDAILAQLVSLLFSYLARYRETLVNGSKIASPEAEFRRSVAAYVRSRYPQAHLADLAALIGYDPAYLSGKIRRTFGKTFQTLVQEERLAVAERLLRTTDLRVEEIVRSVGYENQTHFHALFRRAYGDTPHRYRLAAKTTGGAPPAP